MMRLPPVIGSLIATTCLLSLSLTVQAGSPARGQQIAEAVCASCHGLDGNLVLADDYPKIGGQHADYLVVALRAYRSGARDNAIMGPFAQELSDRDIRDLAAWFSRQDSPLTELR